MAEEAVVQKRSRVKEELRIAKHATQRTETLRPYSGQERRLVLR